MSIAKRVFKGTFASAVVMAYHLVQQALLLPILITTWGTEGYGTWIALQSVFSVTQTVAIGHQLYLNGEIAKQLPVDSSLVRGTLASGLAGALLLGVLEFLLFVVLAVVNDFSLLGIPADVAAREDVRTLLLIQGTAYLLTVPVVGCLDKLYAAGGQHYARSIWWAGFHRLATAVGLVVFALTGTGLLGAAIGLSLALLLHAALLTRDVYRTTPEYWPALRHVDLRLSTRNLLRSLAFGGTLFLQSSLTNGLNLMISGLVGVAMLPTFSSVRTITNTFVQVGLMVANPALPELVRFEVTQRYDRLVQSLSVVWLVSGGLINLGGLAVAVLIEPVYEIWTRGEIAFDRALFSYLMISVCLQALGTPLSNQLIGMNRLRPTVLVAIVKAATTLGLGFALLSQLNLRAFAIGIAAAELIATVLIPLAHFRRSLPREAWPELRRATRLPASACAIAVASFIYQALRGHELAASAIAFAAICGVCLAQWHALPAEVRERLLSALPLPRR